MLDGVAVTVAPVVEDRPVEGLHEYEFAPEALKDCEPPRQILEFGGLTVTVGGRVLLTTTGSLTTICEPLQLVYVTCAVYVVVCVGHTLTVADVPI